MKSTKPRVLILGSTGLTGHAIADELDDASDRVEVVRVSRDPETVERWRREGRSAVRLDLDDARTFPAAADAGVGHIVHLGIFGNGRSTDPHFAWHELVERYIEGSG